jgi:polysaccharide export outer membrane protein
LHVVFAALASASGVTPSLAQSRPLSLPLENQWTPARALPNTSPTASPAENPSIAPAPDRLSIGVGDQIFITVFGQPDMSAEVTVNDNLQVTLPLIGTLKVGGLTPPAIEKLISQRLKEGQYLLNPEVSIQVRQIRSHIMSVLGEVQKPGRFVIAGKMTILDALATAGGLTQRADSAAILIRRSVLKGAQTHRQEITVSMNQILESTKDDMDLELKNDDVVFVAQQKLFYVFGEVRKPGAYPMEPELNVMRVLSISGGVTDRGSMKRIRIHRKDPDQKIREVTPDLGYPVLGGDVIYVDERLF